MALVEGFEELNSKTHIIRYNLYDNSVNLWETVKKKLEKNINTCLYLVFNKSKMTFLLENDEEKFFHLLSEDVEIETGSEIVIYPSTFQKYYCHYKKKNYKNDGYIHYSINRLLEYCVISLLLSRQKKCKTYVLNAKKEAVSFINCTQQNNTANEVSVDVE